MAVAESCRACHLDAKRLAWRVGSAPREFPGYADIYGMKTFLEWMEQAADQNRTAVDYLKKVEGAGYRLLIHQTAADTALDIIKSQPFQTGGNASGTSAMVTTDALMSLVEALTAKKAGREDYASGLVHRDSDAVLIMAIPVVTTVGGERVQIRRADDLDSVLADLVGRTEVPNNYILGVWIIPGSQWSKEQGLRINGKFDPKKGPM